jgi:exopolysaccharide biosynthesis polyprenyl glycosylphosphotransferase
MSPVADKPHQAELENLQHRDSSAKVNSTRSRRHLEQITTAIEVVGDLSAAAIGLIGAYGIYHLLGLGKGIVYPPQIVVGAALSFALVFVLMLHSDGAYRHGHGLLRIRETERILRVSSRAFLLLLPVSVLGAQLISRWVLGIGFVLVPVLAIIQKQIFIAFVDFLHVCGRSRRTTIIYGAGFTGKRMFSALVRSPKLGLDPVVIVDDDEAAVGRTIYSFGYRRERCAPVVSGPMTAQLIRSYGADLVVVAIPSLEREKFVVLAAAAAEAGAGLAYVPSAAISSDVWVDQIDVDGLLLMAISAPNSKSLYDVTKRIFDFLVGVTLLVFLAPPLAVLALAVRIDSEGPVIFRQSRVGKNGRLFDIYKFRSMRADAPKYGFSPTESEDPRITRVGRFLRKTSLDELPQLWNVLKGDMSLVGPRPEMPFIVGQYGSRERQRLCVAPGITGLWQLSADRAFLIHENLQYDLYYIRHRGFFMDIAILLHTAVFAVKGI